MSEAISTTKRSSLTRVDEWGLLRGLSFFAIVMQHSLGEFIYRSDILYPDAVAIAMLYHFIRYGTLTFVFLAGAILFYQYGKSDRRYAPVLVKRIGDIYVPFALWTIIYWIFTKKSSYQPLFVQGDLPVFLQQFIAPTYGYHLWFVVMIFQFYVCFPLFRSAASAIGRWKKAARSDQGKQGRIALLLTLLTLAYGLLMFASYYEMPQWQTSGLWKTLLDYRTYEFPYYAFYFILGGICGTYLEQWRIFVLKVLPYSTLLFVAMYIWMNLDMIRSSGEQINLNYSTYLKPSSFIAVTAQILMLYGWALLLQKQNSRFKKVLAVCAKYSFGAYLSHAMFISLIAFYTKGLIFPGWHLLVSVLTALIVAPVAILLCVTLSRLPGGHWLTGGAGRNWRLSKNKSSI
ncbi:acyltransferase [Saccharibacillus sp. JS10]|uniref:acyltransferase n=1 Tax=Saccharibacillus sp. JS10 TaxID=2950552 RepID=UPI0021090776|nr:acyltransferase [Saccharibacillus sp. JS10]MCQ4085382.1 acyltransferase [Saccharibacillus sp. JS10]